MLNIIAVKIYITGYYLNRLFFAMPRPKFAIQLFPYYKRNKAMQRRLFDKKWRIINIRLESCNIFIKEVFKFFLGQECFYHFKVSTLQNTYFNKKTRYYFCKQKRKIISDQDSAQEMYSHVSAWKENGLGQSAMPNALA
jgi:hypothetical protein